MFNSHAWFSLKIYPLSQTRLSSNKGVKWLICVWATLRLLVCIHKGIFLEREICNISLRGGFAPERDILYQYIEGLPEVYWWNIQWESKLDRPKSNKSSEIRRIKDDLLDLGLSSWDSSWIFPIFLEHWNVTLWIHDLYTDQIT